MAQRTIRGRIGSDECATCLRVLARVRFPHTFIFLWAESLRDPEGFEFAVRTSTLCEASPAKTCELTAGSRTAGSCTPPPHLNPARARYCAPQGAAGAAEK